MIETYAQYLHENPIPVCNTIHPPVPEGFVPPPKTTLEEKPKQLLHKPKFVKSAEAKAAFSKSMERKRLEIYAPLMKGLGWILKADLAKRAGTTPGNITFRIGRLIKDGYVEMKSAENKTYYRWTNKQMPNWGDKDGLS